MFKRKKHGVVAGMKPVSLPGRARVGQGRSCGAGRKVPAPTRCAGGWARGKARRGSFVFWGETAEDSPERGTWPFCAQP